MSIRPGKMAHFHQIERPKEKLLILLRLAENAFFSHRPLLILAPNQESAEYIDNYLWNYHSTSFLPHEIASSASTEYVVISVNTTTNLNGASRLLNLSPDIPPLAWEMEEVHEYLMQSDPHQRQLAHHKQATYQQKQWQTALYTLS